MNHELYPFPEAWYFAGFSSELNPGRIKSRTFAGREIVLYRTQSGTAVAADAHCPHLGAHFGCGGEVRGEDLRCPFHGFRFDVAGNCSATEYGSNPPAKARLRTYPLQEMGGMVFLYFEQNGKAPDWRIPEVDSTGFSKMAHCAWRVRSHPQETAENSVDIGHFTAVHRYESVTMIEPVLAEGRTLTARYRVSRRARSFGRRGVFKMEYEAKVLGLGFSIVHAVIPEYGLEGLSYVMPTPVDGRFIDLTVGLRIKLNGNPGRIHPLLTLAPKPLAEMLALNFGFRAYKNDVKQDFKIWENKKYVPAPALAKGDGPVMTYRNWARQFYQQLSI
jgi:nitrite reductase/ring-hydroxylating ferredoxin subunit